MPVFMYAGAFLCLFVFCVRVYLFVFCFHLCVSAACAWCVCVFMCQCSCGFLWKCVRVSACVHCVWILCSRGEMERDCLVAYGAANLLLERLLLSSDVCNPTVCRRCGLFCGRPDWCKFCNTADYVTLVRMPYACKLLFQDLHVISSVSVVHRMEDDSPHIIHMSAVQLSFSFGTFV